MEAKSDIKIIIRLAEAYRAHLNHSLNTVSLRAAKQGTYLSKLSAGSIGITLSRRDAIMAWFSGHWPDDLEWPRDIPRPAKRKDAA